uniref:EDR1/CTR1/ARMC3-like peptidase-like domain-containing protein n=1 Tax=Salix viminalis TaxID=40686 RepID=A0A6N2KBV1_SALVM
MFRGTFLREQGDLHKRWKLVSRRLRDFHKCIVLPIGSLSTGLCRHRAILFKNATELEESSATHNYIKQSIKKIGRLYRFAVSDCSRLQVLRR